MKTKMFSVFDVKATAYGTPFFMPTIGMAIRAFTDVAADPQTQINKHPEDYVLYELGEFDDCDGSVAMNIPPKSFGAASNYAVVKPELSLNGVEILNAKGGN